MILLSFAEIDRLTRYQFGIFDVPCPECGPDRQSPPNRTRKVLRVWREGPNFATFCCARCGLKGYARRDDSEAVTRQSGPPLAAPISPSDPTVQAAKALAMWRRRQPAPDSPVDTYLRQARGYHGPLPATIGFLEPFRPGQHPAMITAFGVAPEPEPGTLAIDAATVTAVHLTLLRGDGAGKAGTCRDKFMVGPSAGLPIVLSAVNDALGLVVCEGIETGLSLVEATGCGVWAAGAAPLMPTLADKVPHWINCVTIAGEPDSGLRHAVELSDRLTARGVFCEVRTLRRKLESAA